MKFKLQPCLLAVAILLDGLSALAMPLQLAVQPFGSNQVRLTMSPVKLDVNYTVMVRSNGEHGHWIIFSGAFGGSNQVLSITERLDKVAGLNFDSIGHWKFAAGIGEDSDGDGLFDLYEDLASRTDPYSSDDPYGDPDGDNRSNYQEMQNNTDLLEWDQPPSPSAVSVNYFTDDRVKITWSHLGGTQPKCFLIERSIRTEKLQRPPPGLMNRTNARPYLEWQRQQRMRNPGRAVTYETSPWQNVATIPAQTNSNDYRFEMTNAPMTPFSQRVFRIRAEYSPPVHRVPKRCDAKGIQLTVRPVVARQSGDGYDLTIVKPAALASYLLLVRDDNDRQWRAAGFFTTDSNAAPVKLHVDSRGMMAVADQRPIALPEVKFLTPARNPEFTVGSGEDSDGDGLPDIYEVLVTQTAPDNADTGDKGILDGYREITDDGWSNLEKFRRRVNPFTAFYPPPPVELPHPTMAEMMQGATPRSNLRFVAKYQVRINGQGGYQTVPYPPMQYFRISNPKDVKDFRADFDVRVFWGRTEVQAEDRNGYHGP